MDSLAWGTTVGVLLVALFVVLWPRLRDRGDTPVALEGVLEEGLVAFGEAQVFVEQMTPVALTLVQGLRQKYLNGEMDIEELKPEAMEAMKLLFPDADEALLDKVVEGAVFAAKLAAGMLWHKKAGQVDPILRIDNQGRVGMGNLSGTISAGVQVD